jgi:hypothetical protein
MEDLSKLLIDFKFPKCSSRKNVLNGSDKSYEGFNLGYIRLIPYYANLYGYTIQLSNQTKNHNKTGEIYEKILELAHKNIPDFDFSTVQLNKNYKIAKHIDKRNTGVSYICAVGDYTGGELLIYFDGKDKPPTPIDIKNKFYTFDGTKYYHEVADFTGNRISMVFYNIIRDTDIKEVDWLFEHGCKKCDIVAPIKNNKVTFDNDYVIAIPTYQRYNELLKKTLPTLINGSVNPDLIHIFVANEEEKFKYEQIIPKEWYINILVGEKGIRNQRKYISKYFTEGTKIVSMDDDIEKILIKVGDKLEQVNNIDKLIRNNFDLLKEEQYKDIHLWGVYPTPNALWLKEKYVTSDLRFCIGVFHGYINRHNDNLYPDPLSESKEDYEQSILFYKMDGGILRFNNISFKTKFNAPGGLGQDRYLLNKTAQEYLVKNYPEYCKEKFRKNGTPEIYLFKKKK